jgi:hypothetical protein
MKRTFYHCFLTIAVVAMSACSAEDGETGPAGPQGEQGPPGKDGNANVISSEWMPISWNAVDNTDVKLMFIEEERITEEFLTSGGVVLVYLKQIGDGRFVFPLPTNLDENTEQMIFVYADISELGKGIFIQVQSTDGTPVATDYESEDYAIQYILIPNEGDKIE